MQANWEVGCCRTIGPAPAGWQNSSASVAAAKDDRQVVKGLGYGAGQGSAGTVNTQFTRPEDEKGGVSVKTDRRKERTGHRLGLPRSRSRGSGSRCRRGSAPPPLGRPRCMYPQITQVRTCQALSARRQGWATAAVPAAVGRPCGGAEQTAAWSRSAAVAAVVKAGLGQEDGVWGRVARVSVLCAVKCTAQSLRTAAFAHCRGTAGVVTRPQRGA